MSAPSRAGKPKPPAPDPYLPGHGDPAYRVEHYDLRLDYRVATNALRGEATIRLTALTDLETVRLDLAGLAVAKVTKEGKPVKWRQHPSDVVVRTGALAAGKSARLVVRYAGHPRPVTGRFGDAGWEELTDGALVASQPYGAPSFFPCNDRPSDKATYRIEVETESGYDVVATGDPAGQRRAASRTRWVFEQPKPTATYLLAVHIGRYADVEMPGPVPLRVHHPPGERARATKAFGGLGRMTEAFTKHFGPYPFGRFDAVVTHDDLEIPLEAQQLATFGRNHLVPGWANERLIAHELAHQWFGNSLTVRRWSDIWLHEGFACYAEWLWSEWSGRRVAAEHADEHWRRIAGLPADLLLADPGAALMFDDRVYKRGALTLHALRTELGDKAFFGMLRDWVTTNRYAGVTTPMFVAHVEKWAGRSMDAVFDPWLFSKKVPRSGNGAGSGGSKRRR
ncbi:MAG: M1 family metallopeptidase [Dermatophilaceae bacterium]